MYDMEKEEVVTESDIADVKARKNARSIFHDICLDEADGIFMQTLVCPDWDYVSTHVSQLIVLPTHNYSTKGIYPRGSFDIKLDKERVYIYLDEYYSEVKDITNYFTDDQLKRILPRIQPLQKDSTSK